MLLHKLTNLLNYLPRRVFNTRWTSVRTLQSPSPVNPVRWWFCWKTHKKAADETMHFFKLYSDFLKSNPAINSHTLPISPTIESLFKAGVDTTTITAPPYDKRVRNVILIIHTVNRNYHACTRIIKQLFHVIENIWFNWTPDLPPMSKPGFSGRWKKPTQCMSHTVWPIFVTSSDPLWKHN